MPPLTVAETSRSKSAQIIWWRLVEIVDPLGHQHKNCRISVLYASGRERAVPATFRDRDHLSKYIERYYPGVPEQA